MLSRRDSVLNVYIRAADGDAGWASSSVDNNQRLNIDLLTAHDVTKVILQGTDSAANAWTKQFKVRSRVVYGLPCGNL